jgi:hypothetical protein
MGLGCRFHKTYLGVNNLATVTNNFSNKSFILNGKPIKLSNFQNDLQKKYSQKLGMKQ